MRQFLIVLSTLFFCSCASAPEPGFYLKKPHTHIVVNRTSEHYQVRSDGAQTVHVLSTVPLEHLDLIADMCFIAVQLTKEEWAMTFGDTTAFAEIEEFAVIFMPKRDFYDGLVYGFITHKNIMGKDMPAAVVRLDRIADAGSSGLSTVSHEVIHSLRKDYTQHPLNHIQPWYGDNSVESRVRDRLIRLWAVKHRWPAAKAS